MNIVKIHVNSASEFKAKTNSCMARLSVVPQCLWIDKVVNGVVCAHIPLCHTTIATKSNYMFWLLFFFFHRNRYPTNKCHSCDSQVPHRHKHDDGISCVVMWLLRPYGASVKIVEQEKPPEWSEEITHHKFITLAKWGDYYVNRYRS